MSSTTMEPAIAAPQPPLRVALLGAGIFATTCHAPVIKDNPSVFDCIAVWSRRSESSEALAATLGADTFSGKEGLQQVLQLSKLDAIIMALPLDVQPKYVVMALEAGKNILSEKPIAATVSEAKELQQLYSHKFSGLQWSIAENFRYEPAMMRTAAAVKNEIGNPFLVSLNVRAPFTPDNKYLNTPWRKDPSWYGGLFIDAFVHASAMLRMVFGDATMVSAITSSQADFLPGVDTMVAHVQWKKENGAGNDIQGSISVTYACTMPKFELDVTGTDGTVLLQRKLNGPGYQLSVNKGPAEEFNFGGIDAEFLGFAAACRNQQSDDINTPEEAIKDLAFVEACLESGKNNGAFTKVAI